MELSQLSPPRGGDERAPKAPQAGAVLGIFLDHRAPGLNGGSQAKPKLGRSFCGSVPLLGQKNARIDVWDKERLHRLSAAALFLGFGPAGFSRSVAG